MKIEILATESLGVRSLCCLVTAKSQRVLLDPGIALGYTRYRLLPHPLQVAVDERIQDKIVEAWSEATDIVVSHFHGDHTPLVNANPYQLNIAKVVGLNPHAKIWAKLSHLSPTESKRLESICPLLSNNVRSAPEKTHGALRFSKPVPHGRDYNNLETVVMTRIEEDRVFVHASDIQLLNDEAISQIISWEPDIVLASGPPLYLFKLSGDQMKKAWYNAVKLSQKVATLVLDHHLLRSRSGETWLENLSSKTQKKIMCGADFMEKPRMLLEACRKDLYKQMPVPEGWHEAYARGEVKTDYYWNLAKEQHKDTGFIIS
jgi:predicted metallo-beta-lactamase superfamily hydrolase